MQLFYSLAWLQQKGELSQPLFKPNRLGLSYDIADAGLNPLQIEELLISHCLSRSASQ